MKELVSAEQMADMVGKAACSTAEQASHSSKCAGCIGCRSRMVRRWKKCRFTSKPYDCPALNALCCLIVKIPYAYTTAPMITMLAVATETALNLEGKNPHTL